MSSGTSIHGVARSASWRPFSFAPLTPSSAYTAASRAKPSWSSRRSTTRWSSARERATQSSRFAPGASASPAWSHASRAPATSPFFSSARAFSAAASAGVWSVVTSAAGVGVSGATASAMRRTNGRSMRGSGRDAWKRSRMPALVEGRQGCGATRGDGRGDASSAESLRPRRAGFRTASESERAVGRDELGSAPHRTRRARSSASG